MVFSSIFNKKNYNYEEFNKNIFNYNNSYHV